MNLYIWGEIYFFYEELVNSFFFDIDIVFFKDSVMVDLFVVVDIIVNVLDICLEGIFLVIVDEKFVVYRVEEEVNVVIVYVF